MAAPRRIELLFFTLTLALLALLTHAHVFLAGNDASRFAQIEALVDAREPQINQSRYAWTVDRVSLRGKDYSNKPPLLSVVGAGLYFLLQKATSFTFASHEAQVIRVLTLLLVGLPTAWLVALFHASLSRHCGAAPRARVLATIALAAGTILTSYSGTLNNHTVTAALLFAAFHSSLEGDAARAGAFCALSACIDIVPGALFVPVFAFLVYRRGSRAALTRYAVPLAAGVALFVAVNLFIVGYPLPPKMVPGAVDRSSSFAASVAGVLLPDSWLYPLECLFGAHGFFSVSPVLLFGAAGLWRAARSGAPLPRQEVLAIAGAIAVMTAGHVVLVGSYGGWSYGFRYLIPVIPLLLFFAPPVIEAHRRLFLAVLPVSVLLALVGAYNPWPPAYEQERNQDPVASLVRNPVAGNAAAFLTEHFPRLPLTGMLAARFISPSPARQTQYLLLFFRDKRDRAAAQRLLREAPRAR